MQKSSVTVALVCCFVIAASFALFRRLTRKTPQTTQTTQPSRSCPPLVQLASMRPLACYIDDNHLLGVGNASATAIPKGTRIFFTAKLVNAGAYCGSALVPKPIPPHLYVFFSGQPLFDNQAPCQAWREVPPVLHQ